MYIHQISLTVVGLRGVYVTFAYPSVIPEKDRRDASRYQCCECRQVHTSRGDSCMVHVCFMGVHFMLDSSIMSSTSFIKSLYQMFCSM